MIVKNKKLYMVFLALLALLFISLFVRELFITKTIEHIADDVYIERVWRSYKEPNLEVVLISKGSEKKIDTPVSCAAIHSAQKTLVIITPEDAMGWVRVTFLDALTLNEIRSWRFDEGQRFVRAVAVSNNQQTVAIFSRYASGKPSVVSLCDYKTGQLIRELVLPIEEQTEPLGMAFSPDDSILAYVGSGVIGQEDKDPYVRESTGLIILWKTREPDKYKKWDKIQGLNLKQFTIADRFLSLFPGKIKIIHPKLNWISNEKDYLLEIEGTDIKDLSF